MSTSRHIMLKLSRSEAIALSELLLIAQSSLLDVTKTVETRTSRSHIADRFRMEAERAADFRDRIEGMINHTKEQTV